MNVFIWEDLEQVSDNYHCGGGAVIIARDAAEAADLIASTPHLEVSIDEWDRAIVYAGVESDHPRVFIFPDAGCC